MRVLQSGSVVQTDRYQAAAGWRVNRLACLVLLTTALLGSTLLLWASPKQVLAACLGPCSPEQASTGLSSPPSWAAGRDVHFEAASSAASAYGGEGIEGEGEGGPLLYHESGHGVQHTPKVYVIFWGSNFTKTEKGKEVHSMLLKLYEGLTASAYQGILTQYFDSTSRVGSTVTTTSYIDESVTAPKAVNILPVEEEVTRAISTNKWTSEVTAQFVVITAPESTYETGFLPEACAEHSLTVASAHVTADVVFGIVPYQGDPPFSEGCLSVGNPSKNPVFKTSKSASHEYAEAATDPEPSVKNGTYAWRAASLAEIGDICSFQNDLELPSGAYAQNEYDDHQNKCSHEDLNPPHAYAITEPASSPTSTNATLNGTVNAESTSSHYYFELGTTPSYGTRTSEVSAGSGVSDVVAKQTVCGLAPSTEYDSRVATTNSTGTTYGENKTFKTEPSGGSGCPSATTEAASNVRNTEATLNGTVNPDGLETKYHFEYGTDGGHAILPIGGR